MRRPLRPPSRRALPAAAALVTAAAAGLLTALPAPAGATAAAPGATSSFVVLVAPGATDAAARAAVAAAGGTVRSRNADLGYLVADSAQPDFGLRAERSGVLLGAARNRTIGKAPADVQSRSVEHAGRTAGGDGTAAADAVAPGGEPLSGRQWDMRKIGATPTGSYATQPGSKQVLVGIIDTGVDGNHPDIAPNFDRADSRNFTTDIPDIDGPCEVPSCVDPNDVDDDGHGTHVASTIGAPVNGIGIAGVAPGVTLVNLRAGQDSGYFFLQPTLDALTAAGRLGVDVVNMSFYVDPWLYNCTSNPADSPEEQLEQKTIRRAVQRALNFARNQGVLPVSASGNEATDLGAAFKHDDTSPDYPADAAHDRTVTNNCISVPAESEGVMTVNATGFSGRKAYYSNYGTEQSDVSAPGGDAYDTPNGKVDPRREILAAYPENVARANGDIDGAGRPTTPAVVRSCAGGTCAYWQYLQGTSMASPHAAGVAALVVSQYGTPDTRRNHAGGLTLDPATTQARVEASATDHACPAGGTYTYRREVFNSQTNAYVTVVSTATCEGGPTDNGFYGDGIVSASRAVSQP